MNFNNRMKFAQVIDHSRLRVGKNKIVNRLTIINDQIEHEGLNLPFNSYKLKCKALYFAF